MLKRKNPRMIMIERHYQSIYKYCYIILRRKAQATESDTAKSFTIITTKTNPLDTYKTIRSQL